MMKISYIELALAIAEWVHQNLRAEGPADVNAAGTADGKIVDNGCESGAQIATAVLAALGLLEPLDDIDRRYRFIEPPERFRQVIADHQEQGLDHDILMLAAICLLQSDPAAKDLNVLLTQAGVLHPADASGELRWRPEKAHYDSLYGRWPELVGD